MTNAGTWMPAPRGGLIPLHPYGFGTILGKSFAALRGNPKVLLGIVVGLQMAAGVLLSVATAAITFWAMSRLDTVPYGTEEYRELEAGASVISGGSAILLGIVVGAVAIIAQAVVVGEVSYSALGEKATLGRIWARVKGRVWALVGYTLLMAVAIAVVTIVVVLLVVLLVATADSAVPGIIALVIGIPGAIVLYVWLYTKLYVVTPAIVLERAGVFRAIGRSWSLTRGRFWPTFGVYILLSMILGTASMVIIYPLMFLGMLGGAIFAPTGGIEAGVVMSVVTVGFSAVGSFLVQCVTSIVVSTSSVLVYVDARMRREGIDMRMQRYVEARHLGHGHMIDPYAYDPNDVAPPRPSFGYGMPMPGYGNPAPAYPAPYQAPGLPSAYAVPDQQAPYPPQAPPAPYTAPGQQAPYSIPAQQAPYSVPAQAPYGAPPQPPYATPGQPQQPPYAPPAAPYQEPPSS